MKIQKRLLWSILPVVFISVLSVTGVAIYLSSNTIENQVKKNAQLLSKSYSTQLNSRILQIKRMSRDLASAIVTAVNVETVLIDVRKRYPELHRVLYTSLDGHIKDMSPYNSDILSSNYSDNIQWNWAIQSKETIISDPEIYLKERVFLIYTPVIIDYLVNQEPEVIGVLVLAIPADYVFRGLDDVVFGDTGSLFVINKDGYFIFHKNPSNIMKKRFIETANSSELQNIEDSMKGMYTGLGTFYIGARKNFVSFAPIIDSGWSLSLTGPYSEFTSKFQPIIAVNTLILIASLLFSSILIYLIVHGVAVPLSQLTDISEKISEGNFSLRSRFTTKNEVGQLSRSFDSMVDRLEDFNSSLEKEVLQRTQDLRAANEELTAMNEASEVMNEELTATNESLDINAREMEAMNEELKVTNESMETVNEELQQTIEELDISNKQLERTKDALWGEMELAQKLQTVLLPHNPSIEGLDISAFMVTTSSVGGDYYDVINIHGKNWFLIGDVSGHGVSAGLIMMMVQTSIHVALSQNPNALPGDLLTTINKTIYYNISKLGGNRYMTLTVFACMDDNKFSFAGAHLPVIIYRSTTDSVEMLETTGAWVGLVEDIEGLNSNSVFSMKDGDAILLYTDGISEAVTESGEQFSQQGLAKLFKTCVHSESEEICNVIRSYSKKLIVDDDITAMVIKKVPL